VGNGIAGPRAWPVVAGDDQEESPTVFSMMLTSLPLATHTVDPLADSSTTTCVPQGRWVATTATPGGAVAVVAGAAQAVSAPISPRLITESVFGMALRRPGGPAGSAGQARRGCQPNAGAMCLTMVSRMRAL
jgi:hypothetical protein